MYKADNHKKLAQKLKDKRKALAKARANKVIDGKKMPSDKIIIAPGETEETLAR